MIRQHDIKLHKERTLPVAEMIRLCGCIVKSEEYVMLVHFSAKE
jgi:hypothetical protein